MKELNIMNRKIFNIGGENLSFNQLKEIGEGSFINGVEAIIAAVASEGGDEYILLSPGSSPLIKARQ